MLSACKVTGMRNSCPSRVYSCTSPTKTTITPPSASTHLANVDGRVDGVAHIHDDVGAQQLPVAREHVQLHLAHGGAKHKVVEGAGAAKAWAGGRGWWWGQRVLAGFQGWQGGWHRCRNTGLEAS